MRRHLGNILQGLTIGVLCLFLLVSLWQLGAKIFFHQELPSVFGYSQLAVLSGSMEPAISTGDMLLIHREESYGKDDIISFWEEGSLVTHRIIEAQPEGFVTKGDANNIEDAQIVSAGQIAGRVALVIPGAGRLILFLRTPFGIFLLIAAGLIMMELPEIIKKRKQ